MRPMRRRAGRKSGATLVDLLREVQLFVSDMQTLQTHVDGITTNLNALSTNVQAMQDALAKQVEINDKLQGQLVDLDNRMSDLARSGGAGSSDNLLANMDKPEFRDQFEKAVQGKVVFENSTGQPHRLFINGRSRRTGAGRSYMYVPMGRVVIHTQDPSDGQLVEYTLDNWEKDKDGKRFVLNVPVLEASR